MGLLDSERISMIRSAVDTIHLWCVTDRGTELAWHIRAKAYMLSRVKKDQVLPEPYGSSGGADLRFHSPQPDTSLRCQTTDTGLVYRAVCLFTFVTHY